MNKISSEKLQMNKDLMWKLTNECRFNVKITNE